MRDIVVEIDTTHMNVFLIKLMRVYDDCNILSESESLVENYVFLKLVKAGVPLGLNKAGEFKVLFGTLDIGVNTLGGVNNPLYVWRDIDSGSDDELTGDTEQC